MHWFVLAFAQKRFCAKALNLQANYNACLLWYSVKYHILLLQHYDEVHFQFQSN